tara:strand:+ start:196 stop:636 length:441 start_codon:yes stop_codon:yes gene_type:complete
MILIFIIILIIKMAKKKKKKVNKPAPTRPLPLADVGQLYAQVTEVLGNKRFRVLCQDGQVRLGHLSGRIRSFQRVLLGTWVIVSLREFQDTKVDIILKLEDNEVKRLQRMDEIIEISEENKSNVQTDEVEIEWEQEIPKEINIDDI